MPWDLKVTSLPVEMRDEGEQSCTCWGEDRDVAQANDRKGKGRVSVRTYCPI